VKRQPQKGQERTGSPIEQRKNTVNVLKHRRRTRGLVGNFSRDGIKGAELEEEGRARRSENEEKEYSCQTPAAFFLLWLGESHLLEGGWEMREDGDEREMAFYSALVL